MGHHFQYHLEMFGEQGIGFLFKKTCQIESMDKCSKCGKKKNLKPVNFFVEISMGKT